MSIRRVLVQLSNHISRIEFQISMLIFMWFSAKVYEEEDFDPRDYNYILSPDIANTKACFMLKEAEDDLLKKAKADNKDGDVPEVWSMTCFPHTVIIIQAFHP